MIVTRFVCRYSVLNSMVLQGEGAASETASVRDFDVDEDSESIEEQRLLIQMLEGRGIKTDSSPLA